MQIICVGDLCCDLVVPYGRMREALREGAVSKETADSLLIRMQCGGSVGNVARHLGRLGSRPVFLTPLKRDELGTFLAGEMEKAGADMRWAAPSERSNMYCIAVLDEGGERTMFSFVPPWADYPRFDEKSFLNVPHAEESILFTSGMAILDDPGNNAAVLDFFRKRRAEGARIVFDLNVRAESYGYEGERRRAMEEMIALSDIVLGSGPEEFGQVTGQTDLREAARILLGRMPGGISGHRAVIARDGGHPILVLEAGRPEAQNPEAPETAASGTRNPEAPETSASGTMTSETPAPETMSLEGPASGTTNPEAPASREFCVEVKPVKPVSTLGAGDCFDAMFLFALAKGEGIGQAVRAASDHAGDYISGRI